MASKATKDSTVVTTPDKKIRRRGFRRSLQFRLILILLLLLIPAVLIQAYVFRERVETRRSEELQSNLEIARAVAKAFDSFVEDVLHQELAVGIALTSSPAPNSAELNRLLAESAGDNSEIGHICVARPDGNLLACSPPDIVEWSVAGSGYFKEILGGRKWVVSDLLESWNTKIPSFTISRGIRNSAGKLIAVVITGVNPDKLDGILGIERSHGASISIVDRRGLLVYHHPALSMTWEERNRASQVPLWKDALAGKEAARVVESYEGNKRIAAVAPVSSIGWAAGAGRAEDVAMAAILKSVLPQTILFLFVTIVVFGIALAFSRRISTMVAQLRSHALALGRGETQNLVIASGCSELEDLADAFNKMSEEIECREEEGVLAGAALRASEEYFRLVFDKAPIGATVIGLDYRFLRANETFCQITGYSSEELFSFKFTDLTHPEDRGGNIELVQAAIRGEKESCHVENRYIRKDGEIIWLRVSGQVIRDQTGQPRHMVSMVEEVTERIAMENSLREARDGLELRVLERTAELRKANGILQEQAANIKTLSGLLPICSHCKKIRNDEGYWQQIESYIHQHSGTSFSHGVCPECLKKHYSEFLGDKVDKILANLNQK